MAQASIRTTVQYAYDQEITLTLTRSEAAALHYVTGKCNGLLLDGIWHSLNNLNICAQVQNHGTAWPTIRVVDLEVNLDEVTEWD